MTMKERDEKDRQRWKKNRHAVLTLRQNWVEQEAAWRCKDKRQGKRDREGKVRGETGVER